ncbi:MAG: tRNA (cytidine(34)-2'-O)-methyltransferase [Deltaproteobacteria bacterium]|nr:tRNA (cytidine(34)-2'-O)-methyltransferase [Deltaproteobacteria bacterium]
MHVVLVEPLIPQNTGSIARLCAGTNTFLHLVGKLGFSLEDRYLKRAGLDYWPSVKLELHESWDALVEKYDPQALALFSTHATRFYTEFETPADGWLVFGQETTGLPVALRERYAEHLYKIPITGDIRSLNLANSVSIALYEGLRRHGFAGLS